MSPKVHIPCGIISGAIVYAITKSLAFSVACCLANFVFDVDHCLEYTLFCIRHKEKPTLKRFFSGEYFADKGTLCVVFHGYEYILLFLIATLLSFYTRFAAVWLFAGILIGYSEHMALDLIGNDCSVKGYSLIYRILVHFAISKICVKDVDVQ
ncbi:MAG: hypothetical protein PUF61_14075 [Spirochaetales bacterium]|nr:hypothetical protein [Spirochaetales bacterium]